MSPKADILDHLFADIAVKASEDPTKSYTASLLADAPEKHP